MQARAVHGVFKMVESMMVITTGGIKLMEPTTHEVKTDVRLLVFCLSGQQHSIHMIGIFVSLLSSFA